MADFIIKIRARTAAARKALASAVADGDDYLTEVLLGELESLARIAADHGIELDGVEETLSRHGLATPAPGIPLQFLHLQAHYGDYLASRQAS